LDILKQALKLSKETGNTVLTGRVLNNLGIVYYRQRKIDKAETYFRNALEFITAASVVSHNWLDIIA
jgi:Tfp pilus assembly protein PilF